MTRLPFEAFVIVRRGDQYLVMHRTPRGGGYWHGVAGALERNETFAEAAKRELEEETGLVAQPVEIGAPYVYLLDEEPEYRDIFPSDVEGVTVRPFLVEAPVAWEPTLNAEHDAYRWCSQDEALELLRWPDSKVALRAL
jgi:8-oxo-dGTP pyrophosphatase MutT (NUDIX family)